MCMTAKWSTKSLFNSLCPLCNAFLFNYIKLHFLLVSQSHIFKKKEKKMMNVVCLCVLSLVLVAIANLAILELNILVWRVSNEKPADHFSGPSFVISLSLVRSIHTTWVSYEASGLTSFRRESKTVLFKADSLGCCFCFCFFVFAF